MAETELDLLFEQETPVLAKLGVPAALHGLLRDILLDVKAANDRLNLVSDAGDRELFLHMLDSLQALRDPEALRENARIIDVGTGGGFPGLPLLAVRSRWRGTLLDSVRKKTDAVGEIARSRFGDRVEALWSRSETLAREEGRRDAYDLAFCRAVGRFTTVLELTLPLLKPGGVLLAHRGHEAPEMETAAATTALGSLGGRLEEITPYSLPGLDKTRYIVRVVKTAATLPAYPRREGVPAKRPL